MSSESFSEQVAELVDSVSAIEEHSRRIRPSSSNAAVQGLREQILANARALYPILQTRNYINRGYQSPPMELIVEDLHIASVICVNGLKTPFTLFIKGGSSSGVEAALERLLDLTTHLLSVRGREGVGKPVDCQARTTGAGDQGTWYQQA